MCVGHARAQKAWVQYVAKFVTDEGSRPGARFLMHVSMVILVMGTKLYSRGSGMKI